MCLSSMLLQDGQGWRLLMTTTRPGWPPAELTHHGIETIVLMAHIHPDFHDTSLPRDPCRLSCAFQLSDRTRCLQRPVLSAKLVLQQKAYELLLRNPVVSIGIRCIPGIIYENEAHLSPECRVSDSC